ncbi:MAG TPA: hypothetical protein PKC55_14165 [Dysgonomonas sp.]|uniref:hypothetical protein n=1 Tax=unclassified Dysgonomonas TaxID=2630389 RepID=UPI0025C1A78E|nr:MULTISPECIES: hypothetical protein [unclassified Dysgonomonas]HML65973.1 hypothetical protein [Dysgonomonas sp.]
MNEEKRVLTASKLSRMVENNFPFNVFKSQKSESLPHSFFFDSIRSKVIARVTRKSLRTFSDNLRAYLALAGGCDHAEDKSCTLRIYHPLQNTLPMVACSEVTGQPTDFAPGGRKKSGLQAQTPLHLPVVACVTSRSDAKMYLMVFHTLKRNSYGK